jgi:hypothetical protein
MLSNYQSTCLPLRGKHSAYEIGILHWSKTRQGPANENKSHSQKARIRLAVRDKC